MIWLKSLNLYAMVALVVLGGVIVTGIFRAGANYNEAKHERATEKINKVIVEDRGKDEAEISAEAAANAKIDEAVKAALKQRFVLDEETAALLASVR